jgi:adenosylcobinamide-GDP ribazoletransferase
VNALRAAFAYFSILPVGFAEAPGPGTLAALPFVGIVLGAIAGTLGWLASLVLPPGLAVAVAFGAGIVLTGAIHFDGFLDSCDALFAAVTPERRREILKDPRHGTFALAGVAVMVPASLAALAAIPPAAWPASLAFCAGASRAVAVLNAVRVPYAPDGASARAFEERPNLAVIATGTLVSAACCWLHPWYLLLLIPAAALSLALGAWCGRRLGGILAGDCYGAIITVLEVSLLTALATLAYLHA